MATTAAADHPSSQSSGQSSGRPAGRERSSTLRQFFERRKGRFSYLLALLLAQLLLSPWANATGVGGRVTSLFAAAAVLAALYAVSKSRRIWIPAVILAVPAFLHRLTISPDLRGFISLAGLGASILFDVLITAIILDEILRHDDISSETISGALCAYLTAGYAFGYVYRLLVRLQPDSFLLDQRLFNHAVATQPDLIYYSYVTLIALGTNGMSPATPYARTFSMIEGILGIMYLTVLLGRLVGLHVSQRLLKTGNGQ